MEPIVSPWWFYLAGVCDKLNIVCSVGLFFVVLLLIAILPDAAEKESCRNHKTARKISVNIGAVLLLGLVFIPSRQDIYMMMTAKTITYDNISTAKDNTLDFIKQIANSIQQQNQDKE